MTICPDFASCSTSQVELSITVAPLRTFSLNVGEASLHESEELSSLLASASSEQLANHEGVGCSKAEPQVGRGKGSQKPL